MSTHPVPWLERPVVAPYAAPHPTAPRPALAPAGDDPHGTAVAAPWRHIAAAALRGASRALDQHAARLTAAPRAPEPDLDLDREFHAEAGAPEGALFVNGEYVGHLSGVTRL